MTWILSGIGVALAAVLILSLCRAAARGDERMRRDCERQCITHEEFFRRWLEDWARDAQEENHAKL